MEEVLNGFEQTEPVAVRQGGFRIMLSIALLLCFYYTIPVIKTPYGWTTYIRLDDILSFIFVGCSISAIINHERLSTTRFLGIMIIALFLALPSIVWGFLLGGGMKNMQYGIWQTIHYTKIFLVFLSIMVLDIDIKTFRKMAMLIWCGSIFVGIYGGLQYFGILSFRGWIEEFAQSGPWGGGESYFADKALGPLSHNHACIGAYMMTAVFIALYLVRTGWGIMKPIYMASIPFFMVVILWSGARADFFGLFIGLFAYMIGSRVRPAAVAGSAAVVVAAYVVINSVPVIRDRFLPSSATDDYSSGRLTTWYLQIKFFITHPHLMMTGIGLGNYSYLRARVNLIAAHNNYLHFLAECGFLGIILPLIFLKRITVILKQLALFSKEHRELSVAVGSLLVGLLAVAGTQEVFVPSPGIVSYPVYFAFILGAVVSVYRASVFSDQYYDQYTDGY